MEEGDRAKKMLTARSRRLAAEEALARKRDKEYQHYSAWNEKVRYYKTWERGNEMFQNWTSPRYYETSNDYYDRITAQRKKKDDLERRREKLRKMLLEEQRQLEYEFMVTPRSPQKVRHKIDDIPTEVLKDVHLGIKIAEEEKRRKEAELKLYHKWRSENPVVREYERSSRNAGLKVAWLDHQIEKRMQKEKEDEDTKALLTKRDILIKEEIEREKEEKELCQKKLEQLKLKWDKQVKELEEKELRAKELKRAEDHELDRRYALELVFDEQKKEEERRKAREVALFNIKQYKLKMKQKSQDVQENLEKEQELIRKLLKAERHDRDNDTSRKMELRRGLEQFVGYMQEQKDLEKKREMFVSAVFDSEAKSIWEKQQEQWQKEQEARDKLFKDVMDGLKEQLDLKISDNLEKQRELVAERQEVIRSIEESERMFRIEKKEQERRKLDRRKELDMQISDKYLEQREKEMKERKRVEQELERIRADEEKLKNEIKRIQERFVYVPKPSRQFW